MHLIKNQIPHAIPQTNNIFAKWIAHSKKNIISNPGATRQAIESTVSKIDKMIIGNRRTILDFTLKQNIS